MRLFLAFLFLGLNLNAQQAYRITALDNFNNPELEGTDIWNDITGWYQAEKGKEYAIFGSTDSIYFYEITTDNKLKFCDVKSGISKFALNRDYETYSHYAYCVSDQATGTGMLQIFDLRYLPDSVHEVYRSNELMWFSHTIFADSVSKRLYLCGNSGSGAPRTLRILSLEVPDSPFVLADLQVPAINGQSLFNYVHEMFVRNDTVYLSTGNTGLFIFDLSDLNNHRLLGKITQYPDQGYNHSSWLDASGKYLMFTDENTGLDVKIYDISNLDEPRFVSMFNSNLLATPHNAYWNGNFAYVSSYHDGVQVWDIKNPSSPQRVAWFDTHPVEPEMYGGYKGCWGLYPYLPSKRLIASDLTSGIWLFQLDSGLTSAPAVFGSTQGLTIYPNPAGERLYAGNTQTVNYRILDAKGLIMQTGMLEPNAWIDLLTFAPGVYFLMAEFQGKVQVKKFIKKP